MTPNQIAVVVFDDARTRLGLQNRYMHSDTYAVALEAILAALKAQPPASGSDWFAGDVDCDGEPLTTIPTHEYNRLVTDCEKFRDQVRDTCARAEKAEAELAAVNLQLQERISDQSDQIKALEDSLATALEALERIEW